MKKEAQYYLADINELIPYVNNARTHSDTQIAQIAYIDDAAYSGKENIQFARNEKIHLVSKLNPSVSKGFRKEEDSFEFNKDAGLFVCPEGYTATRKAKTGKKNQKEIKLSHIILTLRNVKSVLQKRGVIKMAQNLKRIPSLLKEGVICF